MIHATFIMEQHLGHQTHYQNLRRFIDQNENIRATWVPVTYTHPGKWWQRATFLPAGLRGSLTGRWQARQGLRAQPCDVLYFNTQVPAALAGLRPAGCPYLISTDITPIQYDQLAQAYNHQPDGSGPLSWYKKRATTRVLRGAARLLPWSSWAGQSLINDYGVSPEQVEVMPVGVDLQIWRPADPAAHEKVRILFVGGDFMRKGGPLLLEAFRQLPPGAAELILVTRTPVSAGEDITVYGGIQPNSPELLSLYQTSDIFVLPTSAEAFGISAVEASASGLPVIATCTGGLADIVADQETGFLVPVDDLAALAARLRILVEHADLRRQMGQAARQRAERLFDACKNAKRLVEILTETAANRENR